MAKFLKYSLVVSLAACLQIEQGMAQAVKGDVIKPTTTIMEQGGKVQGNAQDVMKGAEHVKTYQKMQDGAKEGLSKRNELKQQAGDLKAAAGNLKSSVNSAVDTAKSTASSLAASDAQQLVNLQTQQAQAKSNYEQQVKNLEADRDASLKKYQDNNKVIEDTIAKNPQQKSALQPQIDENNAKIQEITDKYQKLIDSSKQTYERANTSYAEQISSLQSAAANVDPLSNVNAESAKKMVSGLFGGDAGAAMNEIIAKNFYAKDEEESTERNGELTNYRRDTALTDSADVYYQAVQVMSIGDTYLDYVKSLQNNAQVTETTPAAVTLDLTIKVENMRSLLNYARLLVAEMKMLTAQDMVSLPKKLNNYSKDVTAFNLDDYEYKEKKKSLLDQAKDVKKKAGEAISAGKDVAGSVAATAGSAVSAGASAVNNATQAVSDVSSTAGKTVSGAGNMSDTGSAAGDIAGAVSDAVNLTPEQASEDFEKQDLKSLLEEHKNAEKRIEQLTATSKELEERYEASKKLLESVPKKVPENLTSEQELEFMENVVEKSQRNEDDRKALIEILEQLSVEKERDIQRMQKIEKLIQMSESSRRNGNEK